MDQLTVLRARVDRHAEQIAILEERLTQFRETFTAHSLPRWRGIEPTPAETVILDALSNGERWPTERLVARLEGVFPTEDGRSKDHIRVLIWRLRRQLPPAIQIRSYLRRGYQLTDESAPRLAALRIT